jgi:hypothetical protein
MLDAVFPAIDPASFEKLSIFDGPMTITEASATMAISAGPRPKKDCRRVDDDEVEDGIFRVRRAIEVVGCS